MEPNQPQNVPPNPSGGGQKVNVNSVYPASPAAEDVLRAQVAAQGYHGQNSPAAVEDQSSAPKKTRREGLRSVLSTIALFLLAPLIALSLTAFAFQSYQVDGQSMETTLQNNDRLIVNKIPRTISRITHHAYIPHRGDIIVFNQAGLYDAGGNQEKQLIKRVIALPGEGIKVEDGQVTVYNKQHPNGFNPDQAGIYTIAAKETPGDVPLKTLGPNELFVSGDNRGNSEDSRYFGPINASRIVGKLTVRIFPLNNVQKF